MFVQNANINVDVAEEGFSIPSETLKWKEYTKPANCIQRHYKNGELVKIWPCKLGKNNDILYQDDYQELFIEWPIKQVTLWMIDRETVFGRDLKYPLEIIYVEFLNPIDGFCGFLCFEDALDTYQK